MKIKPGTRYIPLIFVIAFFILAPCFPLLAQSVKPAKTGYAPVNGLRIYYEIYGEGKPLVLLHGAYMTIGLNWGGIIPELVKTRKVIALELQGHGHTADISRPFSYPSLASDVAGVLKHLNIDSADILGYSFGGVIAYYLAANYPKLINKLIIASAPYRYDGWLPEVRSLFQSFQPAFLDNTPLVTEYKTVAPDSSHWHAFVNKMVELDKKDYNVGEEKIKAIKSPVLLISGDNDGIDLNHLATAYRLLGGGVMGDIAGLPRSQLAILPGKTHVSLVMDANPLISIVNEFLTRK